MPSNMYSILPQFCAIDNHRYASPVVTAKTEMSKSIPDSVVASGTTKTTTYAVYHRNKSEEKTSVGATGMSPTDAYDASSSDSGFEEVITATSASDDQSAVKMEPPVISNTEEVVYTAASNCGSEYFKAYWILSLPLWLNSPSCLTVLPFLVLSHYSLLLQNLSFTSLSRVPNSSQQRSLSGSHDEMIEAHRVSSQYSSLFTLRACLRLYACECVPMYVCMDDLKKIILWKALTLSCQIRMHLPCTEIDIG